MLLGKVEKNVRFSPFQQVLTSTTGSCPKPRVETLTSSQISAQLLQAEATTLCKSVDSGALSESSCPRAWQTAAHERQSLQQVMPSCGFEDMVNPRSPLRNLETHLDGAIGAIHTRRLALQQDSDFLECLLVGDRRDGCGKVR